MSCRAMWNHALERSSHSETAAGGQLSDDPDAHSLLYAAQCGDFLDLRHGKHEPQQRPFLYLAGKWPHPVHPVRADPSPGPRRPLQSQKAPPPAPGQ